MERQPCMYLTFCSEILRDTSVFLKAIRNLGSGAKYIALPCEISSEWCCYLELAKISPEQI
jgi:hypothetical protein